MRLALAGVLIALAVPALAAATHNPPDPGPPLDFTYGSGTAGGCTFDGPPGQPVFCLGPRTFEFLALSGPGPGPTRARGFFHLTISGGSMQAKIKCLWTLGNRAAMGGRVTSTSGGSTIKVGQPIWQFVVDNKNVPGQTDGFSFLFLSDGPVCPPTVTPPGSGYFPLTAGDIVVHDGQPVAGEDDDGD